MGYGWLRCVRHIADVEHTLSAPLSNKLVSPRSTRHKLKKYSGSLREKNSNRRKVKRCGVCFYCKYILTFIDREFYIDT